MNERKEKESVMLEEHGGKFICAGGIVMSNGETRLMLNCVRATFNNTFNQI